MDARLRSTGRLDLPITCQGSPPAHSRCACTWLGAAAAGSRITLLTLACIGLAERRQPSTENSCPKCPRTFHCQPSWSGATVKLRLTSTEAPPQPQAPQFCHLVNTTSSVSSKLRHVHHQVRVAFATTTARSWRAPSEAAAALANRGAAPLHGCLDSTPVLAAAWPTSNAAVVRAATPLRRTAVFAASASAR